MLTLLWIWPRRSAQFEHTVVITSDGVKILTKLPEEDSLGQKPPVGWTVIINYCYTKKLAWLLSIFNTKTSHLKVLHETLWWPTVGELNLDWHEPNICLAETN